MKRIASVFFSLHFFVVAACSPVMAGEAPRSPVCALCNMKVADTEKKLSVFMPNVSGMGPSHFCDIGCAVQSRNNECATRQMTFDGNAVAYDFPSGEAVPVEKAFFVLKTDIKTPMGYGIVVFKDKAMAEKFASEHGKGRVVRWFELVDEKL